MACNISAATVVTRSITKPGHYTGVFPIDDNAQLGEKRRHGQAAAQPA
jgi:hypothetical protein